MSLIAVTATIVLLMRSHFIVADGYVPWWQVAFSDLQAGIRVAIWPRRSLAHDSGLPLTAPSATEPSLGHNVWSKSEVDAVMAQAKGAGAVIVRSAQGTFLGGYAGYFQDSDQHLWEVVWNPQWALAECGIRTRPTRTRGKHCTL